MQFARVNDIVIHYEFRPGNDRNTPIIFSNSLGTDFRIWDGVVSRLPKDIPILRMDKRGHGLTDISPVAIDSLADDVAAMMKLNNLEKGLICGVSVGGLIAQAMASNHPDHVAGLVLSNTGSKIGTTEIWNERIEIARNQGIAVMADAVMERWFSKSFRENEPDRVAGYRNMLCQTTAEGYASTSEAIRDADYTDLSSRLSVPTFCVSGSEDMATPKALVKALSQTIPGAAHYPIKGVGHLPSIEAPDVMVDIIMGLYGSLD
ncbi:MAG: 3-oxoadipate enol-lactonase [Pseudomonadota bacterium]